MVVLGMKQVVLHLLVDSINSTLEWAKQTATTHNSIEIHSDTLVFQTLHDELLTILILIYRLMEMSDFIEVVMGTTGPNLFSIFINSQLGRSGTWVDSKYFH